MSKLDQICKNIKKGQKAEQNICGQTTSENSQILIAVQNHCLLGYNLIVTYYQRK